MRVASLRMLNRARHLLLQALRLDLFVTAMARTARIVLAACLLAWVSLACMATGAEAACGASDSVMWPMCAACFCVLMFFASYLHHRVLRPFRLPQVACALLQAIN
jgi:hypothetical protein